MGNVAQDKVVDRQDIVVFSESFNRPASVLRSDHWVLEGNTKTVEDDGLQCLEVMNSDRERLLSYVYVKVDPGKRYSARCLVRTEAVLASRRRGATIFAEWVDRDRAFIPGGSYPMGKAGSSPWGKFNIEFTNVSPEQAGFLKLYIGIDGKGKAWFRDLVVAEYSDGLQLVLNEPGNGAVLEHRRPVLSWKGMGRACQLVTASNPSLSKDRTCYSVGLRNQLLLPHFLGNETTWYWQVQETTATKGTPGQKPYCSKTQAFKISKQAQEWPPLVDSQYEWSADPKPELATRVIGPEDMSVEVDIDGERAEVMAFTGNVLKFRALRSLSPAVHNIKFTFTNRQGERFSACDSYSNIQPQSRVSYREGITHIDDEAFFPIGAYCDPSDDPAEFSGVVEAGFNLAHSYVFEREDAYDALMDTARAHLVAAQEHDIKVFLGMPRGWIRKQNGPEITKYVSSLMTYPALLSWYLMDEPAPQGVGVQDVQHAAEAIRGIDPFHPSFVAFSVMVAGQSQTAREYIESVDIIGCDPYPLLRKKPFDTVEQWVENCREMGGKEKPVWAIIEAFDADYDSGGIGRGEVKKYGPVVKPTYDQMKCQAFLSLSGGADGLIFYWMSQHRYRMKEDAPAVWASICRLTKELQSVTSFMTTPRSSTRLPVAVPDPFRVWVRSNEKGDTAIAFINPLDTKQHLKVRLDLGSKQLCDGEEVMRLNGGVYESHFRPYETKVYVVK
ncbi:MAG: hypothetical protein HN341_02790 [Verrucomicrobia bacterium]|nr:hypothetical protein [Verrucomicrobiota bacterium]